MTSLNYNKAHHKLKMVLFRSGLVTCLLASTSYAFAFKPTTPSYAQQRSVATTTSNNRVPVNLSMSGGSSATPDLKAPPAIYEGAVAAGAGEYLFLSISYCIGCVVVVTF